MKPLTILIFISILLFTGLVVGRILSAPSSNISPQADKPAEIAQNTYETKENEGGDVTVSVTPLSFKAGLPASFDVTFETHSVDLVFDIVEIASLMDNMGNTYTPLWDGSPPGGHHRSGTLRFTPDLPKTRSLTLTFTGVAGIAVRTFSWEVNP